ncbi:MAG: hypothetical protein WBP61_02280 [Nocardioides sp.]
MKTLALLLATVLALATLAAPPALAAAPTVEIKPTQLPRGADVAIPHVVGKTIVDGDTRIPVRAKYVQLLGVSGDAYVVQVPYRVLRVTTESREQVVRFRDGVDSLLSHDGEHVVLTAINQRGRSTVRVLDAATGTEVATRTFRKWAVSLDADGSEVALTATKPDRTLRWDFDADRTHRIARRAAGVVDFGADRVSTFTRNPYLGGCTVITSLSRPDQELWRSCREAVIRFSPDGERMVTTHKLADGPGPNRVTMRDASGTALTKYRSSWFSGIEWESNTALLLDANSRRLGATVRCELDECERATRVRRTEV